MSLVAQHINKLHCERDELSEELAVAEQKLQNMEVKYTDVISGETMARDKQTYLMTEVDTLKNQLQ